MRWYVCLLCWKNKGRMLQGLNGKGICLPRQETWVPSPGGEDPLEEGMATHSSILAWEIPWREEPGGLQFMRLQRAGHDLATKQREQRLSALNYQVSSSQWMEVHCKNRSFHMYSLLSIEGDAEPADTKANRAFFTQGTSASEESCILGGPGNKAHAYGGSTVTSILSW